jgi:hypothetical protein
LNFGIRQIAVTGHSKTKPALIITNDFDLAAEFIIKKYARCWLIKSGNFIRKIFTNGGFAELDNENIAIRLKNKRNLPLILSAIQQFKNCNIP